MKKLIFCENSGMYKKLDKSMIWDCYITNMAENCLKYIRLYHPGSILISYKKLGNFEEIMTQITQEYKIFPSVFICTQDGIMSSITDEIGKRYIIHADKIPLKADNFLNSVLIKYNFSPKLKGFTYIKRALYEGMMNDGVYTNIKKILYPNIAAMYLVSESSVERSMSFSIQKAYEKSEKMRNVFSDEPHHPSNLKFLKHFFILIKEQMPPIDLFQ